MTWGSRSGEFVVFHFARRPTLTLVLTAPLIEEVKEIVLEIVLLAHAPIRFPRTLLELDPLSRISPL
jgi:hypothetical protein